MSTALIAASRVFPPFFHWSSAWCAWARPNHSGVPKTRARVDRPPRIDTLRIVERKTSSSVRGPWVGQHVPLGRAPAPREMTSFHLPAHMCRAAWCAWARQTQTHHHVVPHFHQPQALPEPHTPLSKRVRAVPLERQVAVEPVTDQRAEHQDRRKRIRQDSRGSQLADRARQAQQRQRRANLPSVRYLFYYVSLPRTAPVHVYPPLVLVT